MHTLEWIYNSHAVEYNIFTSASRFRAFFFTLIAVADAKPGNRLLVLPRQIRIKLNTA